MKRIIVSTMLFLLAHMAYGIKIRYSLDFAKAATHYISVTMHVTEWAGDSMIIKLPVWMPGSYMVREYSKNIESVAAQVGGKATKVTKVRKNGWKIDTRGANTVTVTYLYYANELNIRQTHTDEGHAFIMPGTICCFVEGFINQPCTLAIVPLSDWKNLSTALEQIANTRFEVVAMDYDELVDSPVEVGNHQVIQFEAQGIPHEFAIYGNVNPDKDKLVRDTRKIIKACTNVFGENPCKRYVFFSHHYPGAGGGLEHKNSCTLAGSTEIFSKDDLYRGHLNLIAHEYFHLWNVKRLRPEPLGPFDYDNENYCELLWFAEGFTAYYDDLITYRCGLVKQDDYLKTVSGSLSYLIHTPGNDVQSLDESGFDAWIKYYRANENSPNSTVSYYTKGGMVGLLLDLEIISRTQGLKNLDTLMRYMYTIYSKQLDKPFSYSDVIAAANTITGTNMSSFFDKWITSTGAVPTASYFDQFGILYKQTIDSALSWTLGIKGNAVRQGFAVTGVTRNSEGFNKGITAGDIIIYFDGVGGPEKIDSLVKVSTNLTFETHVFRRGQTIKLKLEKKFQAVYQIALEPIKKRDKYFDLWLQKED
ncbi:MAG: M61 family metallopeptidase [Bacteroidetes bacterium]|nr:M61 family metallopeptidase [Bacteroidota bacterium]